MDDSDIKYLRKELDNEVLLAGFQSLIKFKNSSVQSVALSLLTKKNKNKKKLIKTLISADILCLDESMWLELSKCSIHKLAAISQHILATMLTNIQTIDKGPIDRSILDRIDYYDQVLYELAPYCKDSPLITHQQAFLSTIDLASLDPLSASL